MKSNLYLKLLSSLLMLTLPWFAHSQSASPHEPELLDTTNLSTPLQTETSDVNAPPVDETQLTRPDPDPVSPPKDRLPASLALISSNLYFSPYAFLVDKSSRTLSIWKWNEHQPEVVALYSTDLGRAKGDKQVVGDHKTPEGVYFFQEAHDGRKINFDEYGSQIFTMDYPNLFDRLEKKSGYGIWLHGIPDSKSLWRGSRGCVVVRDEVIKKLGQFITVKMTPIIVEDKAEYLTREAWESQRTDVLKWMNSWLEAWQSKDVDRYIDFYHSDFKAQKMDRQKWYDFKKGLTEKYSFIKVEKQEPNIFIHGNRVILRFLQKYTSDMNQDFGEKTLHLKKINGHYKIVGETWAPVSTRIATAVFPPSTPTQNN